MDTFDIARMFRPDAHDDTIVFGTVVDIAEKRLIVTIDGFQNTVSVVRACNPSIGSRVVIQKHGTTWIAIGAIGGDAEPAMIPSEVATGRTFLGKPTYIKGFSGGITATQDQRHNVTLFAGGIIDSIVTYGGVLKKGNGSDDFTTAIPSTNISNVIASGGSRIVYNFCLIEYNITQGVVLISSSYTQRTNAPYRVWIEYTKA